jgi:hypothetical protein
MTGKTGERRASWDWGAAESVIAQERALVEASEALRTRILERAERALVARRFESEAGRASGPEEEGKVTRPTRGGRRLVGRAVGTTARNRCGRGYPSPRCGAAIRRRPGIPRRRRS